MRGEAPGQRQSAKHAKNTKRTKAATRKPRLNGRSATTRRQATKQVGSLMPVTPRGEATRRRILDAAEQVFGELGYYEASVAEITRRATVAQGTFYLYFRSKREIFIELVEDMGKQLRRAMRAGMGETTNRLEIERGGFRAFFTFIAEHRQIYHIIEEARRVAPEAAESYYRRIGSGYERGLRAAMDAGEIRRMDPEGLAYALIGIGHFVALRWLIWPQEPSDGEQRRLSGLPEHVFDAVIDFILHGLTPAATAGEKPTDGRLQNVPPRPDAAL
jgi:AcrR family transcriptional regulator